MTVVKRGLGKGLEALLPPKTALMSGKTILTVAIREIDPNPRQPRHAFDQSVLQELANSIKEHGIAQPLLVRQIEGRYQLIAGERRLRAAKLAGLDSVPVIIKNISNEKSLELAIIENVQREDLNPLDEAESYALLMKEFDLTQEAVAQKVGKSRPAIANSLRLNELPREIKESLRKEEISAGHARAILAAGDERQQLQCWKDILSGNLSVRNAEGVASASKEKKKPQQLRAGQIRLSPLLAELTETLARFFGTKINIHGNEQKGKIEISYYSSDDLERVLELVQKK